MSNFFDPSGPGRALLVIPVTRLDNTSILAYWIDRATLRDARKPGWADLPKADGSGVETCHVVEIDASYLPEIEARMPEGVILPCAVCGKQVWPRESQLSRRALGQVLCWKCRRDRSQADTWEDEERGK